MRAASYFQTVTVFGLGMIAMGAASGMFGVPTPLLIFQFYRHPLSVVRDRDDAHALQRLQRTTRRQYVGACHASVAGGGAGDDRGTTLSAAVIGRGHAPRCRSAC
ncbi:hypothetical protein OKW43_006612 [Paraburkholderia sp. WC7.3g]